MTDRPPLNPPETPLCPIYAAITDHFYYGCYRSQEIMREAADHRASCPMCQARKAEFDELAKVAKEPVADQ